MLTTNRTVSRLIIRTEELRHVSVQLLKENFFQCEYYFNAVTVRSPKP